MRKIRVRFLGERIECLTSPERDARTFFFKECKQRGVKVNAGKNQVRSRDWFVKHM